MALPWLFPNQRAIRTKKAPHDANNSYSYYNLEAMSRAMRELKPSAFKLWCYLNKNKDGYEFGLSLAAAKEFCKISEKSYLSAFKELQEKGYIVDYVFENSIQGYLFVEDGFKNKNQ